MKKVLLLLVIVACAAPSFAAIASSAHDFSTTSWATGDICGPCHAPHNVSSAAGKPLWNHAESTAAYTMYGSVSAGVGKTPLATANNIAIANDAKSKLCLSCHDGTVALDSYGGATGSTFLVDGTDAGYIGTDLSSSHPIAFGYSVTAATGEAIHTVGNGYKAPPASLGLVEDGIVSCATCHDVHNAGAGTTALLVLDNDDSALCLTCHTK